MTETDDSPSRPARGGPDKPERLLLLNHDIRSAVSDIVGGLDLIDDRALPPASVLQLERVRAAAEALGRLIEEALSEVTGEPVFTLALADDSRVPLLDLLRNIERRWSGHAQMQGLSLRSDIASDLPILIDVDGTALERILSNLLSNALKYAERGTITLRVDLREGGDLRFAVEDEGPGFSDAALARLFEFRGRPADALRPGTGMGLHICKDLADALGGRLQVANAPRGGAQVSLLLPAPAWQGEAEGGTAGGLPDLSGLRVLVAEDNPTNQIIFAQMLAHMNAAVTLVDDGRAALDALCGGGFDVALVDIDMPLLSGIEVIRRLRALPGPQGRIPALAVTAYVLRRYREEIYRAGADGILAKPILSIQAFGEAIASLIRKAGRATQPAPVAAEAATEVTRIDRQRLGQLLNVAGPHGRAELLRRLESDLSRAAAGLAASIEGGDAARLRAETHILISLAGAVGAHGLQHVVDRMNAAAHQGELAVAAALAGAAEDGLAAVLAEIRRLYAATLPAESA